MSGREGAIEVMNSGYSMYQVTCSNTGKLMGARQHNGFKLHKEIDKTSPFFAVALCQSRRLQKAVIHFTPSAFTFQFWLRHKHIY
ncbi:type VI secretion system tube protein Hcp [Atlantibacter sp.]|uniref:type VI secretion system tube protein Hcp n=1 Tax=Atlantibacter sp. TaxID=1903473 RepID=UPI0028B0EF51|nr:type VI secretion system tube protein Hcp [Atlantibacter sp.]